MNTVIALVGRTKSGKSTLAIRLARYLRTTHVETSDIVRSLFEGLDTEELSSTAKRTKEDPEWLGRALGEVIDRRLVAKKRTVAVVSGIREIEIVQYLRDRYNYWGFEIKSEMPVRYDRAIMDGKYLTADEFLRGEIRELDIGLLEVEDDAPFVIPTSPETDPEKLIRATVKLLRSKGATLR